MISIFIKEIRSNKRKFFWGVVLIFVYFLFLSSYAFIENHVSALGKLF
jgi:hypothetical protein